MFSSRFLFLPLCLIPLCFSQPASAQYYAETARESKVQLSGDASAIVDDQTTGAAQQGGGIPMTSSGRPLIENNPADLHYPELEEALKKSGIDKIAVQSDGVETTLRTLAEIQVNTITGKNSFADQDPVFTLLGMIYENQSWARVPMIPVESRKLEEAFGLEPGKHHKVSSVWVMRDEKVRTLVMGQISGNTAFSAHLDADTQKALKKFSNRVVAFLNLPSELKLVPMNGEKSVWLSPWNFTHSDSMVDVALAEKVNRIDRAEEPYVSMFTLDGEIRDAFQTRNGDKLAQAVPVFLDKLDKNPEYMSSTLRKIDHWQTAVHPFKRSSQFFMLAFFGFLAYIMTTRKKSDGTTPKNDDDGRRERALQDGRAEEYAEKGSTVSPVTGLSSIITGEPALATAGAAGGESFVNRPAYTAEEKGFSHTERAYGDPILEAENETVPGNRVLWSIGFGLMSVAALLLIVALVNRALISGRMPVSNMYESITFAMGGFAVLAIIFEGIYRRGWVGIGACLFGWGLMVMANSMPLQARKVDPLVAVLNSVWLNYHVTSLLISYSCFLLAFVAGIFYFIKDFTGNKPGFLPRAETFEYLIYRCVQVGWPLLTLGIFLGAVWANTAWGSFWSWDPKETWALITWFTYTIYLHLRINLGWTGRRSVVASMIGFLMVLITYFGVSYLPGLAGGMHSYAEPIKKG